MRRGSFVILAALSVLVAGACDADPAPPPPPPAEPHRSVGFHGDRRKLGWSDAELSLTPLQINAGFGVAWESRAFDGVKLGGRNYPPLVYASPLFVRDVRTEHGTSDVVYVATSSGFVYAVAASAIEGVKPGDFLFRVQLVSPSVIPKLDGGVPLGVLSTPILDADARRLYVTGHDAEGGWLAFALDAGDGSVLPGWPIALDEVALGGVNVNGPAYFPAPNEASQRSALTLSPSGDRLYVAFGSYASDSAGPGWLAAIDTDLPGKAAPRVVRSFASAPALEPTSNGGLWAAGGPAIDATGRLWITTGASPPGTKDAPNVWGSSLLMLGPELRLEATYTPYNYCKLDDHGLDLGASPPLLLPNLIFSQTSTPQLVAFGSEQGNVYLLDRDRLQARSERRPLCEPDPARDSSLFSPVPQPHLGARGPLNVFGPFSEGGGSTDLARMRSRPAYFRDGAGEHFLFVSGSHKAAVDSTSPVPPGVAKVRIVLAPDAPAWLERTAVNQVVVMKNPGSPIVTGEKDDAVVWVLDENALDSQSLLDATLPQPVLYAFAARDLALLWKSGEADLRRTGKYGVPAIGGGRVYVASDKLTAFGPR